MTYKTTITYNPPIQYILTWHAVSDACPKCQDLNGRQFFDQDIFNNTLYDPYYGHIWDFDIDQSLTHPNCRCQLEVRILVDWNQFPEIQELKTILPNLPPLQIEELNDIGQIDQARDAVRNLKNEITNLKMDYHTLREMETLLNRTLTILERSTGSKEIRVAINKIQRLITIIRLAQYSIHTFEIASGPIGWALAASGFAMTAVTITSTITQELEGH